jgi:DNA-binding transcriptional LysR family regulator
VTLVFAKDQNTTLLKSASRLLGASPLEGLDMRHWQFFALLMDIGSVSACAMRMGVSQPTVSIWLAQLRDKLGDPLFVRGAGGMQPTPRAQALTPIVHELLHNLTQLSQVQTSFDPLSSKRRFRILMTDAGHITLLPHLYARVIRLAPLVSLEASTIHAESIAGLASGSHDLALGFVPQLDKEFHQQALFYQDWVCLVSANHPRIRPNEKAAPKFPKEVHIKVLNSGKGRTKIAMGSVDLALYQSEAHVHVVSGTGQRLLDNAFKAQHIKRRIGLALPGYLGLSALLSETDLLATVPRHMGICLAQAAGLSVCELPFPIEGFSAKQYWHTRLQREPATQWLRQVCTHVFARATHEASP